jgi:hypothetical protein
LKKAKGLEARQARYNELLAEKIEKQEFYNNLKFGHATETTADIMEEVHARQAQQPLPSAPRSTGSVLARIRRQLKTQ